MDARRKECENARRQVYDGFEHAMKRQDAKALTYICREDVKAAWPGKDFISKVIPADLSSLEKDHIWQKSIVVLSILIYIGADTILERFRTYFLGPEMNSRCDDCLPFRGPQLDFIEDVVRRRDFEDRQYVFLPQEIRESAHQVTQVIDPKIRLPLEEVKEDTFIGGYGDVNEVIISRAYLIDRNDNANRQARKVACKKIRLDGDFRKEVQNLRLLKESITSNDHIMLHIATIIHGDNYYILLPFAEHYNLDHFLHEGYNIYETQPRLIYDFKKTFPSYVPGNVEPLLEQAYNLALALKWLHFELRVSTKMAARIHCAHMDLKPDNILIDSGKSSPVGVWKLCDFGISVIHDNPGSERGELASVGDLYVRAESRGWTTMRVTARRNRGTYQAPEIAAGPAQDKSGVGRTSDVWSFVCILAEVFTFALCGAKGVTAFQEHRL